MTASEAGRPAATSEAVTADRGALMRASRAEMEAALLSALRLVTERGAEVEPGEKAVAATGKNINVENFILLVIFFVVGGAMGIWHNLGLACFAR